MAASDNRAIDVLCTLALRSVLLDIADAFTRSKGLTFSARYHSSNALMQQITEGERADVAVITDLNIATLISRGNIIAGSQRDLAASVVGVAVRKGAPKPDIGSAAALRRALLTARSIAFSQTGASGIHFAEVIKQLGIADEVRAKARIQDGLTAELAARGEVEIAVQQISELIQVSGIDVIGPLPPELQKATVFSAGVFTSAKDPAAASEFIAWLASSQTAAIIKSKGLEPLCTQAQVPQI
jgi:molybdate transport system substrate-binding protein